MSSVPPVPSPPARTPRADWLDALRGFALFGILVVNMQVYSGDVFRGPLAALGLAPAPPGAFDAALHALVGVFVQGKFYALFSFLFGLGVALQLQGAFADGRPGRALLARRLGWLLAIGLAHGVLLWFGDILVTYAILGFGLLAFARLSARALLGWAVAFLASPVLLYGALVALGAGDPLAGPRDVPLAQSPLGRALLAITGGGLADIAREQAMFVGGGWVRRATQMMLPRIFGMFLLGMWAARIGLAARRHALRPMLRRWLLAGATLGVLANAGYVALGGSESLLPYNARGWLAMTLTSIGVPLLALAYVAAFALWWPARDTRGALLVTAGRTALSHYLGQSALCVALFYGWGFGLFGTVGYGSALLIAAAVYAVLALAGRAWLARFAQGPAEAAWRWLARPRRDALCTDFAT